ncbi:F-box domain-containing protein [Fusarium sp. Ph1]|nr:F-box domain-containing protein [Fusarium sp. Ph1]
MNAYIACLLAMLPNLRYLKVEPGFAYLSKLSSRMFRAALSVFPRQNRPKLPHFEQLRDVAHLRRIGSIPRGRPKGANLLTPFFYLPEVHRVSACIDNTPYWRWPEHKPALETLTTLNIAFIHAKHLSTFLSEKKTLQTLRWDWRGWPYTHSTNGHWVNLDEITAALQHVQKTLIELKVLGSCKYLGFYRCSTLEIPLAFLAGLSASVPPTHIDETLPTTVEHVALSDDFSKSIIGEVNSS